MKLVVNARFLTQPLTGVQRYALECSIQIKQIIEDAVFVAPDAILHTEAAARLGAKIIGKWRGHLWEQTDLYRFLRASGNAPLLNLANTAPLCYPANYLTLHDLAFQHHPEWNTRLFAAWYRILIPKIARRSRHLFTVSETVKGEIMHAYGIPPAKISVTPNGIATSFLGQQSGTGRKKQILAVGTFNVRKNHDRLISAFLESPLCHTYRLIIAGSREEVFRQCPVAADNPSISIINRPDDTALARLYQESEILVSLSAYEGFGLPVLEGLYFGCKVLCSDIAVYRELYNEYVYFCDPANFAEISQALQRVSEARQDAKSPPETLFEQYSYRTAARHICKTILSDTNPALYR